VANVDTMRAGSAGATVVTRLRNALVRRPWGVLCLLCVSVGVRAIAQAPPVMVIEGATVIDGTGAASVPNAVVVISGNRISAVGRSGDVKIPSGAKRIDARGQFLIPGLIDAHAHLRDWAHELYLVYGITSIIDEGGEVPWWYIAQKEAVDRGKIRGPRIFTAGRDIRCRGTGMFDAREPSCDSEEFKPANLQRQIQELVHAGVAKLNIGQFVPPPLIKVIVEEAHRQGVPVSSTTFYTHEAIAAGVDAFAHVYPMTVGAQSDEQRRQVWRERERVSAWQDINGLNYLMPDAAEDFLAEALKRQVYFIPILVTDMKALHGRQEEFDRDNARLLRTPDLDYIPKSDLYKRIIGSYEDRIQPLAIGRFGSTDPQSEEYRQFHQSYQNTQSFLRSYVERGGKVLAGTDQSLGTEMHHELQLLVDAGLSPMHALQAATLWPAQFLRRENDVGTIRTGRFADVLFLDADPLADIRNTERIHAVVKGGVLEDLRFHRDFVNPIAYIPSHAGNMSENPVPKLTEISPAVATEGNGGIDLTVHGSGFAPSSVVAFDSTRVRTKFVSDTELVATIPAHLTDRVGTFKLVVQTPAPGGGTSGPAYLIVKFK
jgi:hypothetical protein